MLLSLLVVQKAFSQPGEGVADPSQSRVDSILNLFPLQKSDSARAALYVAACRTTYNSDTAIKYAAKALDYCRPSDSLMLASAYHVLGSKYFLKRDVYSAIPYLMKAKSLFNADKHLSQLVLSYITLSLCYEIINIPDSVFYFLNQTLDVSIEKNDSTQMAFAYQNLCRKSIEMNLYDDAETYIMKSYELDSLLNDPKGLASDFFWLGLLYTKTTVYAKTGHFLKKSIRILEADDFNDSFYATVLHLDYVYLADAYIESAERDGLSRFADSCLYYLQKSDGYFLKHGHYANYMKDRYAYVKYLMFYKKYNEALNVLLDLEQYQSGNDLRRDYHMYLTMVYEKLGNYREAFDQQRKQFQYAMEYVNDSALTAFTNFKTGQAIKQKNIEQQQTEQIYTAQRHRMMVVILSLMVVLLLISLLVVFIYRMLKIKRKANLVLSRKNYQLDQQKNEIQAQRDELNNVHNAVVDSVRYSERIQRAVIPTDEFIKSLFPQSFVYYRPRDIVSGDFYYVAKCGKYNVFVVADCTGHGIPGGFLSMLGISSLKEFLVSETDAANPGVILDQMREFFKETLGSTNNPGMPVYDGMDIIICCFDFEKMEVVYAAANHKAYIIRNGEVVKLMGDKMPVGRYFIEKEHFDTFTEPLQKGDMVYLCSDGIQDQIGGADSEHSLGKKLMTSNFVSILTELSTLNLDEQAVKIDDIITQWRKGFDQVDDITLVGIKI